jgi:hypothetical protein
LNQSQNLKVVFNIGGAANSILDTSATVAQLVMGDNGTTTGNFLTLAAGADLTTGLNALGATNWTGIGYNRDATLTVEPGAALHCANHLWIGLNSPAVGTVDIRGGSVAVSRMLGLGWNGGTGFLKVRHGGTLHLTEFHPTDSIAGNSLLDIESGSVFITGNQSQAVSDYAAAGKITGYGGAGTVTASHDAGANLTTVSATPPPNTFYSWAAGWQQEIGAIDDDSDGDGRSNLYEYALNGDPTEARDPGLAPVLAFAGDTLQLRHLKRRNDVNLSYRLLSSPDLSSWNDAGLGIAGSDTFNADYDEIRYSVPIGGNPLFLRLEITHP